jgi:hypothetical protein
MRFPFLTAAACAVSLASLSHPVAAADVYKCTNAAGKVEFQDRPCDGKGTAQKLDVKPNSVAPTDTGEITKKLDATNKRLAGKVKAEDDHRERVAAQNARHAAECRGYTEAIARQQAWLGSVSAAARQSAANEIAIQQARQIDYGC